MTKTGIRIKKTCKEKSYGVTTIIYFFCKEIIILLNTKSGRNSKYFFLIKENFRSLDVRLR